MTKPYKCRVEYLESTGEQYIDTGYAANSNSLIEYHFNLTELPNSSALFGSGSSTTSNNRFQGYYESSLSFSTKLASTTTYSNVQLTVGTKHYSKMGIPLAGYYIDDTFVSSAVGTPTNYNLYIFARNIANSANSPIKMKLYDFRVSENNNLVRDLIPVLDNNGRPAMYDNVSGQLFYNQGTGADFSYGRQIIPVEYLESTGTQYINTGIKSSADMFIKTKFNLSNVSQKAVFGSYSGASSDGVGVFFGTAGSNFSGKVYCNNTNVAASPDLTLSSNTDYEIEMYGTTLVTNGSIYTSATTASNNYDMLLFARSNNGTAERQMSGKIYYCKIWDNGTLARDYIPAIDENNVPFMFDLVTNTIYENAGTGQFKFGANVEKNGSKKMLRKKLALMLANLKKKRPYYVECEYLESAGTQRIDTGIQFIAQDDYIIKTRAVNFDVAKRSIIMSNYHNAGYTALSLEWWAGSSSNNGKARGYFQRRSSSGQNVASPDALSIDTPHDLELHFLRSENTMSLYYDGNVESITLQEITNPDSLDYNLCLFLDERPSPSAIQNPTRIYYLQIYRNNTLIRDMIPVLDWDMTPCMYDKISGQLFYNQGTGDFSYGREIHPVEYLESTGTQYIDTGIKQDKLNIEIKFRMLNSDISTYGFVLGARQASNESAFVIPIRNYAGSHIFEYGDNTNFVTGATYDLDTILSNNANVVTIDGATKTLEQATFQYPYNVYLFACNQNGSLLSRTQNKSRIYYCKMVYDNILVRDFIPAIDENGVGFMFDRVTHTIFDNAGQGSFKYPAREVEYLKSSGTQYIDTGYIASNTSGFSVKIMPLQSIDSYFIGSRPRTSAHDRWVAGSYAGPQVYIGWNTNTFVNWTLNNVHTVQNNFMNSRTKVLDGTVVAQISETLLSQGTRTVYLFSANDAGTVLMDTCRIYKAQISEGSELVRNFIPVFYNGQAGMWDKENSVFYGNAGTGSFVAGKVKEDLYI